MVWSAVWASPDMFSYDYVATHNPGSIRPPGVLLEVRPLTGLFFFFKEFWEKSCFIVCHTGSCLPVQPCPPFIIKRSGQMLTFLSPSSSLWTVKFGSLWWFEDNKHNRLMGNDVQFGVLNLYLLGCFLPSLLGA